MKEVPPNKDTPAEKMPSGHSGDATRPDHSRRTSFADGQPESSDTRQHLGLPHDTLRQGMQDISLNSDQQNHPQSNELPQAMNTSSENPRDGTLREQPPKQPGESKTTSSALGEKAREMVKRWKSSRGKELPQTVNTFAKNSQTERTVNAEALLKEMKEMKELQKAGKVEGKTVESASWDTAQFLVKQWQAEGLKGSFFVGIAERVLQNIPAIQLAAELDKTIARKDVELSLGRQIPLRYFKNASNPEQVPRLLVSHYEDNLRSMKKDYQSLVESFPKSPSEVNDVQHDNYNRGLGKAQAMVDKWVIDDSENAAEVNQDMVFRHFKDVIIKATALEKAPDVISVKQSLREAEEQFPKNPSEVLEKEQEWIARQPMNFDRLNSRLFRGIP